MGVEPIGDRQTCRPPVLKTGTVTGPHALPYLFTCEVFVPAHNRWQVLIFV
jgi:hypothetical protein